MRIDTAGHLTPENAEAQATLTQPAEFHVIQIEPSDEFESVLVALRLQSEAVILVLPEQSQAFNDPAHFAQLREICSPDRVSFVIPRSRMGTVARYANAQGFSFASTPDATARLLIVPEEVPRRNDQEAEEIFGSTTGAWPGAARGSVEDERGDLEAQAVDEPHTAPPLEEAEAVPPLSGRAPRTWIPTRFAKRRRGLVAALFAFLAVVGVALLPALFSSHLGLMEAEPIIPIVTTVGQVAFSSSGQLDPLSSRGINDIVTVSLHNLSLPAAGQNYYAWLLPDQAATQKKPLWLGRLIIDHNGKAQLTYMNPDHENLLASYSRFEVIEEPGNQVATTPPFDPQTVRYVGSIPDIPTPGDEQHYSLLDHLRHLLAADPTLQETGLSGGLDIWLDRNAEKILEWSSAARDAHGPGAAASIHRQMIRVLDYLDGVANVYSSGDISVGTPILVDPTAGRIGLLDLSPTQVLPSYLTHVHIHLQGLANAPGHTQAQEALAVKLDKALKTDTALFQRVHEDAFKLVKMDAAQIQSNEGLSLLDDMVTNANMAYTGQFDPASGGNINGIAWIHNQLQGLATMTVTAPTHTLSFDARRSDA